MEHHRFIDEVFAEPTSTFEKAIKLRKVGVSLNTALHVLCKRRKPNDETSTAKTNVLGGFCDRNADNRRRHPTSVLGDSSRRSD